MTIEWFTAKAEAGGVMMASPVDPLDFVWQTPEQVREIIAKLEAALSEVEICEQG